MTHPELRGLTARKFVRALEQDGFDCRRINGSHHIYAHRDGRIVTVAFHASGDTFPPGTLRAMLRGTEWNARDLVRLGLLRSSNEARL